ncbi:hypothetical protein KIH39_20050 [Telmatocola sphagniphila]|uniref:Uncharacterized protein n=1 Tax=Telmatocola sphagniphila TaxID=1123043 RepID=A0A8E6EXD0_9BACT|nr:hypothetical protein [Telmatocola sphagniphila]QVL31121.1 hypothetical protein KIH39_20050 [Telmatocola sphagniphila]
METWQYIWRNGFAPLLPTLGLEALRKALKRDDSRILQGATTYPLAVKPNRLEPIKACCALSYCGWRGESLNSVGEIEQHFDEICAEAGNRLGHPEACRPFLEWYDTTPRSAMRFGLLGEIDRTLNERFRVAVTRAVRNAA